MAPAVFAIVWVLLYGIIATCLALRLRRYAPDFARVTTFASVMSFGIFGLMADHPGSKGVASFAIAVASVIIGMYFQIRYRPIPENE